MLVWISLVDLADERLLELKSGEDLADISAVDGILIQLNHQKIQMMKYLLLMDKREFSI